MRVWVNRVLSAIVILYLAVMCVGSVVDSGIVRLDALLSRGDASVLPVQAVRDCTEKVFSVRFDLYGVDIAFQRALGKKILDFGPTRMVQLKGGYWYDIITQAPPIREIGDIVNCCQQTEIPALFVYAQTSLYEKDLLPEDIARMDRNAENITAIVGAMKAADIPVMDSREVFAARGYTMDQIVFRTDPHWTPLSALTIAQEIVRYWNETQGFDFDERALALDAFTTRTYSGEFLGEIGQRMRAWNAGVDDITLYLPKGDTAIHSESTLNDETTVKDGPFSESVMAWDRVEHRDGAYRDEIYYAYGYYQAMTHTVNERAPEGKVLVFKDSYGTPVSAFLSLACREVVAVDMRYSKITRQEWIETIQPDVIVFVQSQKVMHAMEALKK